MLEVYPKLDQRIITVANSNSMYNRGKHLEESYQDYIERIDRCEELTQEQKLDVAKKFHKIYSDYANRSANVLSPMVTGPARFPTRQNQKRLGGMRGAWEKVEEFLKKHEFIFSPDSWRNRKRNENKERECIFKCDDYKIVKYTLTKGEERLGFFFTFRIKRQLQVALKSRGFRWNALAGLWGGKIESYEKHKEWCESLSQNYPDYIR